MDNHKKKIINIIIDIIILISNFIITFSHFVSKTISNLDELWNYNTARQVALGLIPYKDISMITTPLLPTINALFLKIAGDELFVFRILTAILTSLILFMIYKITYKLLKNHFISIILMQALIILDINYFYMDYNFFSLLLLLIIEFFEIKLYDDSSLKATILNICIGILAGLSICTKQTIGCFISAFVVILPLINNKQNPIKERIKETISRIIGASIPVITFIVFLIATNSLSDFIDYAILGIRQFTNSISYTVLLQDRRKIIKYLSIAMPVIVAMMSVFEVIFLISKKLYKMNKITKINILILYSFPMLITIYPIADVVHFSIAILPIIITVIYFLCKIIIKLYEKIRWKEKKYIANLLLCSSIIILAIQIIKPTIHNYKTYQEYSFTNVNHYHNLNLISGVEDHTILLKNFYEESAKVGKKVIIVDAAAVIYDIPLDTYHKNYDMFLKGNIGSKGEDGIIKELQTSNGCIYLVRQEGRKMNWQTPMKVINYIRKNFKKYGSIGIFDVYSKK